MAVSEDHTSSRGGAFDPLVQCALKGVRNWRKQVWRKQGFENKMQLLGLISTQGDFTSQES